MIRPLISKGKQLFAREIILMIVGGLITSTLLGIGVTPTVFYTFGRKVAQKRK